MCSHTTFKFGFCLSETYLFGIFLVFFWYLSGIFFVFFLYFFGIWYVLAPRPESVQLVLFWYYFGIFLVSDFWGVIFCAFLGYFGLFCTVTAFFLQLRLLRCTLKSSRNSRNEYLAPKALSKESCALLIVFRII